jgi:hypothetical protein
MISMTTTGSFMEDFDSFLLLTAVVAAGYFWVRWYFSTLSVNQMVANENYRLPYLIIPVIAGALLWVVLANGADPYVRSHSGYFFLYWTGGLAWVGLLKWFLPFIGFSARDELERRNIGSLMVVSGAILGLTFAYAGGNVGEGPGSWVVMLCVAVSSFGFYAVWVLMEGFTQVSETVTVERDLAGALRLTCFLIALGLIMGAAVSGDWIDTQDFWIAFFARAWPALAMMIFAILIEYVSRPSERQPKPSVLLFGVIPSIGYLVVAIMIFSEQFTRFA